MMQERLAQLGKSDGIDFKFGGKTGNTRDSHRLIQLGKAKSPAVQTRVVEELFATYFENEKDITSHDVLVDAGVKAGLNAAEVKEWLDSGKGGPEVDKERTSKAFLAYPTSRSKTSLRLVERKNQQTLHSSLRGSRNKVLCEDQYCERVGN